MTNGEYVYGWFRDKVRDADIDALVSAYMDGVAGEIETICETCKRVYPGQCTAGQLKPCKMTLGEWAELEVVTCLKR